MLRRVGILGTVGAVAALTVGSVAPATGNGGDDRDEIVVTSTITEDEFVDVGESGPSLGDAFIFTADLTDEDDEVVGHAGVVCTLTSVEAEESQCVGTASLDEGQITVQGLLAGEPEDFEIAITGGTGAYEGAGGTLEVEVISDTEDLLTFSLD